MWRYLVDVPPTWFWVTTEVMFFVMFSAILIYVLTDRRKDHHDRMSSMALNDSPHPVEPITRAAPARESGDA